MTTTHSGTIKICENCGGEYRGYDPRDKYCGKPMCKKTKRTKRRAEHDLEFVPIDGEATGRENNHRYILVGCGTEYMERSGRELEWGDVLAFLYECFRAKPAAAYVGFFLGYDFTQWFKGLPESKARALWTNEGKARRIRTRSGDNHSRLPVDIRDEARGTRWEIDALDTRWVKFRPKGERRYMTVCDAGSFFQQSFESVIAKDKWLEAIATDEEYAIIKAGKANRDKATLGPDMIRYMCLENELLARVMTRLNQGFSTAGVRLNTNQWYGPGQAAQKWFDLIKAPTALQVQDWVPKWARKAARDSYFGGWFEIMMHGYIPGPMWEYDIHSAYPHIIRSLPCLEHGTWTQGDGENYPVGKYTLIYAEVEGSDPHIGAMLHRDKSVNIRRPHKTGGWYWLSEVRAAQRAGLIHTVKVSEWVNYDPCKCPPPLAAMEQLYNKRVEFGNASAAGKAFKLLYNSSYGKTVQSIGHPKYANPIYGSLITSGCRTQILEAIASHPGGTKEVAMVATDGVYFRSRHTGAGMPITNHDLGTWEEIRHENMTLFKPGVYWDDKNREQIRKGDTIKFKARGVNARDFAKELERVDSMWPEALNMRGLGLNWPKVDFTVSFTMMSIKQALQFPDHWDKAGRVTSEKTVTQSANAEPKRKGKGAYWDNGIIRTPVWDTGPGGKFAYSNPYAKPMGDSHLIESETPDGPIEVIYNEIIGWETEDE